MKFLIRHLTKKREKKIKKEKFYEKIKIIIIIYNKCKEKID